MTGLRRWGMIWRGYTQAARMCLWFLPARLRSGGVFCGCRGALSKVDAVTPEVLKEQKARLKRAAKCEPILLSSASGAGVPEALRALMGIITKARTEEAAAAQPAEAWHP